MQYKMNVKGGMAYSSPTDIPRQTRKDKKLRGLPKRLIRRYKPNLQRQ
jgi:hypothetical protein